MTLDTSRRLPVSERLCFSRTFKTKNPAALFTCRESRAVAKRRYRPAFGTENVYFDFAGGDILYFGPECFDGRLLDQEWEWVEQYYWVPDEPGPKVVKRKLSDDVVRDLEAVRHLAIARELWNNPREAYARFGYNFAHGDNAKGDLLRKRLRRFKGVERISFEWGKERINEPSRYGYEVWCGGAMIEDPWFEERSRDWRIGAKDMLSVKLYKEHVPRLEEWLERDGRWEVTGDLNAVALLSRFDTKNLSEEEKEKGIPEARLVDIKFVFDEPRRVREHSWF